MSNSHTSRRLRQAAGLFGLGITLASQGWAAASYNAPYYISTLAGAASLGSKGSTDGSGNKARFNGPYAVAVDGSGNLFVADNWNRTIRKITPGGVVSTFAGTPGVYGAIDGPGGTALFSNPVGIAVDATGNVYVADTWACTIRKITPAGVVSTLAGLAYSVGSADGAGSDARFNGLASITVDAAGMLYVVDSGNKTIRKITPAGVVTTLAGTPGVPGWNPLDGPMPNLDGQGASARFISPQGIGVDGSGNLFVSDEHTIRKITPDGMVTTLAGLPGGSNWGSADGLGSAARFTHPYGVATDRAGNVYVAEGWDNTIRKITPAGMVSTLAGLPAGYPPAEFSTNATDGVGSVARFNGPQGVAVDSAGTVYVADTQNNTIRKITPAGSVTTLAGMAPFQSFGSEDGPGALARFASPHGTAVDATGNVYVADCYNHTIRKISPAGQVTTLAGTAGVGGSTDGTGASARFYYPKGVAVDGAGTVYVTDTGNETVRKITAAGVVTTLAGLPGVSGMSDGLGSTARFNGPVGVAVDSAGTLYVADTDNDTIRKISPAGQVTTLAGTAGASGTTDATGVSARFFAPEGIAVDATGTVYVADTGNFTIRKITPTGVVTTLAGLAGSSAWVDGAGSAARFYGPEGIAVDGKGMLYVVDNANYKISKYIKGGMLMLADGGSYTLRKITPAELTTVMAYSPRGVNEGIAPSLPSDWPDSTVTTTGGPDPMVSTLAGESQGDADGIGINAQFDLPRGISVDAKGTVYVSCSNLYSNTIRKGQPAGPPVITTQPQSQSVVAGGSVQFSVAADGAPPPKCQWYFNGAPFSGATDSTLSFTTARASDAGDYSVVLTNELGSVTSAKATLTVTAAPVITPTPVAKSGGGGGGAISPLGLAALALLVLIRRRSTWRTFCSGCLLMVGATLAESAGPTYYWTTLAGRASIGIEDGAGASARFSNPTGVAFDATGNLYIADTGNHTIRRLSPSGIVTTLAGSAGLSGIADGAGAAVRFNAPEGIATDTAGNVYVADTGNHTIRKISPTGVVSTLAGLAGQAGNTDGAVTTALFNAPRSIAVDSLGNVFVFQEGIRRITAGTVKTILSSGTVKPVGMTGPVMFFSQSPLAVDASRRISFLGYVMDGWPRIGVFMLDTEGTVTLVSLDAMRRNTGPSTAYLAIDPSGAMVAIGYIDRVKGYKGVVLRTTAAGQTKVGDIRAGSDAYTTAGGLAAGPTGDIVYSRADNVIVKMLADGTQTVLAGQPSNNTYEPSSLTIDSSGNIWAGAEEFRCFGELYESYNEAMTAPLVLKVAPDKTITTPFKLGIVYGIWGNGPAWVGGDGSDTVHFTYSTRVDNLTLGKISPTGVITESGLKQYCQSFVIDPAGNLICPRGSAVWKRSPADEWSILAGKSGEVGTADGSGDIARFGGLVAITADRSGNFYVLDGGTTGPTEYMVIRRITPGGAVSTVSGNLLSIPGLGELAYTWPAGLTIDRQGKFYLTNGADNTVWSLIASGEAAMIGGSPKQLGSEDGVGQSARFVSPGAITVDVQGNLYVGDGWGGAVIRKGQLAGAPTITGQTTGVSAQPGMNVEFRVTATGVPAPTYQWYFNGAPFSGATTTNLSITNVRTADAGDYTVVVTNELGSVTSQKATLTVTAAVPEPNPWSNIMKGYGGGGGAISPLGLAALALLVLLRHRRAPA